MVEHKERPRLSVRILGTVSLASGIAAIVAPRRMGRLYKMPGRPALVRSIGLRDVMAGALLLKPRSSRAALLLRGMADAVDSAIVASQLVSQAGPPRQGGALAKVAMLGSVAFGVFRRTTSVAQNP
jgi:hypothetical protein